MHEYNSRNRSINHRSANSDLRLDGLITQSERCRGRFGGRINGDTAFHRAKWGVGMVGRERENGGEGRDVRDKILRRSFFVPRFPFARDKYLRDRETEILIRGK